MATPGFTAEASLGKVYQHYVRVDGSRVTGVKPLVFAQQLPVGEYRIGRVLRDGIEFYGNWCGPLHGSGQPIDAVDRVCCIHDHCYDDRGYLDCSCDRALIEGMDRAMTNPYVSSEGRNKASQAAAFFRVSPCLCNRICLPWIGCFRAHPVPGIPLLKQCIPPYA